MKNEQASIILRVAAERLERVGWFGGISREEVPGVHCECAMLAISNTAEEMEDQLNLPWGDGRAIARDQLLTFLGIKPTGCDTPLWNWNDAQTSKAVVVAAMKAAA